MKEVVRLVRNPAEHWVGDRFPVRTVCFFDTLAIMSPLLLLDYAGPAEFVPAGHVEAKRGGACEKSGERHPKPAQSHHKAC